MRTVCNLWANRSISLKGRITVFNSLIFSLLQYPCLSTVTPTRAVLEVKKLAAQFIWENKRSKVAYNSMIQRIKDGGLQLMDLKAKIEANLLTWVVRISRCPNSSAGETIKRILEEDDIATIFASKFDPLQSMTAQSPFYMEILRVWALYHNKPPHDENEVRSEILWNNTHVPLTSELFPPGLRQAWKRAGVLRVKDLCHPSEDRLLSHQEIEDRYGIQCNFLQALTFRLTIPHLWRHLLSANFSGGTGIGNKYNMVIGQSTLDAMNTSPKEWYRGIVREACPPFSCRDSWIRDLNNPSLLQNNTWQGIFSLPFKTSSETKLQSFAFKMVNRLTPCGRYLHKIKTRNSPLCEVCGKEDSLLHFFLLCTPVQAFWEALSQWCEQFLGFSFQHLSQTEYLLGITRRMEKKNVINWLLLTAKFHIQRQRLFHQSNITFLIFWRKPGLN